jgi:hypothetical protein
MTTALLVLAQSGRGGDSGDSGDGLLILIGVLIAVAIALFVLWRFIASRRGRGGGDPTSQGGTQPPGHAGNR